MSTNNPNDHRWHSILQKICFTVSKALLLALALSCSSCENRLAQANQLAACLKDLRAIGGSYQTILSNENWIAPLQSQIGENCLIERVGSENDLVRIKKGNQIYLVTFDKDASLFTTNGSPIIACSARANGYYSKNSATEQLWAVAFAPGSSFYSSEIPPVPGCVYDSLSLKVVYPKIAVQRFTILYPELLTKLENQGFKVTASTNTEGKWVQP